MITAVYTINQKNIIEFLQTFDFLRKICFQNYSKLSFYSSAHQMMLSRNISLVSIGLRFFLPFISLRCNLIMFCSRARDPV